jgi:hypothetical protein
MCSQVVYFALEAFFAVKILYFNKVSSKRSFYAQPSCAYCSRSQCISNPYRILKNHYSLLRICILVAPSYFARILTSKADSKFYYVKPSFKTYAFKTFGFNKLGCA